MKREGRKVLKDTTEGRKVDGTTRVFKTKASGRNAFLISHLSSWDIDRGNEPVYFQLLLNVIWQWQRRRKYKTTIQDSF